MASPTQWTWVWVTPGTGEGQGGLACCSPWGHKESDMTEWLNWKEGKEGPFIPSNLPDLVCYPFPGPWAGMGAHAGLDGAETAGRVLVIEPPPPKPVLSGLLGWEQSPRAPKGWRPNPLTSRTLESHLTLGLLVLWCPIQASFLRAEPPGPLSRVLRPRLGGWTEGRGDALEGEVLRPRPCVFPQALSTIIHSPGSWFSLRTSLQGK